MKVTDGYDANKCRHVMGIVITYNELKKAGQSLNNYKVFIERLSTAILNHTIKENDPFRMPEWRYFK